MKYNQLLFNFKEATPSAVLNTLITEIKTNNYKLNLNVTQSLAQTKPLLFGNVSQLQFLCIVDDLTNPCYHI